MKVYISGKIGEEVLSEATREKFARAEAMLRAQGYEVRNPASQESQGLLRYSWGMEKAKHGCDGDFYSFALVTDIVSIWKDCDAVYMLPDFLDSPGAKAEHAFAIATGKQVYYADELFADGTLRSKSYEKNRLPEVAP